VGAVGRALAEDLPRKVGAARGYFCRSRSSGPLRSDAAEAGHGGPRLRGYSRQIPEKEEADPCLPAGSLRPRPRAPEEPGQEKGARDFTGDDSVKTRQEKERCRAKKPWRYIDT
jgi:hypothetical protein